MPIRQPVQITLRISDFYDKAFSFPVESIVDAKHSGHSLLINATGGYLLTTSLSTDPAPEQSFLYKQQPNGQWVAEGVVTILATGEHFTAGEIRVHDPLGETVVLTVDAASALSKLPELMVTYPSLTITQSLADKPGFMLLTIAQQQANTPVTVTTDLPAYFQLASDSRPVFGPSLTLVPSPAGTIIHVRYFADKRGSHTCLLTIEAPYDRKAITLTGKRAGLLPLPGLQKTTPLVPPSSPPRLSATKRWVAVVLVGILGATGLIGYRYSCQLFPAMCQGESLKPLPAPDTLAGRVPVKPVTRTTKLPTQTDRQLTRRPAAEPTERDQKLLRGEKKTPVIKRTRTDSLAATKPSNEKSKKGRKKPQATSADKESELEKALNHPL